MFFCSVDIHFISFFFAVSQCFLFLFSTATELFGLIDFINVNLYINSNRLWLLSIKTDWKIGVIFLWFFIRHPSCRHSGLRQFDISFGGINIRIDDICIDEKRKKSTEETKIQKQNNGQTLICLMERNVLSLVICCRCFFFISYFSCSVRLSMK